MRVQSVYSGGISNQTSSISGVGVTLTGNGIVPTFASGNTRGLAQTRLSERFAPLPEPAPESYSGLVGVLILAVIMIAGLGVTHRNWWLIACSVLCSAGVVYIMVVSVHMENFQKHRLMPWYRRYIEAWNQLYYCERCDIVYASDSDRAVRPEEMNKLLFSIVGSAPSRRQIAKSSEDDAPR